MAHPRIIQQQMLDWIKNSLSLRSALPTDTQIVDRFNLRGVESARSLLADLADAGEITIKGHGATRSIALGRKEKTFEPAPRPTPAVVARIGGKRADDEKVQIDTAAARIREIIERGKEPASENATSDAAKERLGAAVDSAVKALKKQGEAIEEFIAQDDVATPTEPTEPDAKASAYWTVTADDKASEEPSFALVSLQTGTGGRLSRQEAAIATRDVRRQLNIHFPQDQFEKLAALADVAGETPGAFARGALISCIARKPRVPAAVTAAALREKAPVIDFADRMMILGLAAYAHERAGSAA
ncbi:hypothetical protein [Sphingomonas echinoides]|uniref:hypothetical protein n=1 Tax=Sphingomonas echinoides TaxID=59803 RepID=UPI0024135B54|nr:hypothetical protein [Sphingomonas echinoides]